MTTDDERRRVAAELRKCRGGWSSDECYYAILHALDLPDTSREDGGHALYAALADLIDPGESVPGEVCEIEGTGEGEPLPPIVDREALLAEAKEAEKIAWYFALDHDENELRDRLAEAAEDFSDMARRIREACGEVGCGAHQDGSIGSDLPYSQER